MDRVAAYHRFAALSVMDLDLKAQLRSPEHFNRGGDLQQIVVARAALKLRCASTSGRKAPLASSAA